MKTVRFTLPIMRGLAVLGLATGVIASALAAPVALAAPAAPEKPVASVALPAAELVTAPAAAPATATVTATAGCATTYVVQSGDTLWRIGLKYGVEWPQIAAQNSLANPGLIYAGQSLCLLCPVSSTRGPCGRAGLRRGAGSSAEKEMGERQN